MVESFGLVLLKKLKRGALDARYLPSFGKFFAIYR